MTLLPSMTRATVRSRLDVIEQRVASLEGLVRLLAVEDDLDRPPTEVILSAAREDLGRCSDELTWLHSLSDDVLNLPAPTEDERAAATAAIAQGGAR